MAQVHYRVYCPLGFTMMNNQESANLGGLAFNSREGRGAFYDQS